MADDVKGGLRVQRDKGTKGWTVVHTASNLPALKPVRYQKTARQARTDLLATGCDFTLNADELRRQVSWPQVRKVYESYLPQRIDHQMNAGPRMVFIAKRNTDKTIHITNILEGMTGQHHVHDDKGFAAWMAGKPSVGINPVSPDDVKWQGDGPDCICGQGIWNRP